MTIRQTYDFANEILAAFEDGMLKSGNSIYSGIISQVKALEVDQNGIVTASPFNKKQIFSLYGTMINRLDTQAFNTRVASMLDAIPLLGDTLIEAYVDTFGDVGNDTSIIFTVQNTALTYKNTIDISAGAVNDGVFLPLLDEIYFAVGDGSTQERLLSIVQAGLQTKLDRFFKTRVHTTVFNALREMQNQLDDWYGNNTFKYVGPKDGDNRDFCHVRAGKTFRKAEIQSWAGLDWNGKIPGTTSTTIFQNLGGYNCRHFLQPVKPKVK